MLAPQQSKVADAITLGDGFDMSDFADDFDFHSFSKIRLRV
jgi:hypothetical protein